MTGPQTKPTPHGGAAPAPRDPPALRRPPALTAGDRVALISPSSHQGDASPALRRRAVDILSGWGLEVANAGEAEPQHIYFAGNDAQRARQFESLYRDPEIRALFLTRGGYGASRILPLLDCGALASAPPKLVVGFSDATALFAFLHRVAGISVVHGPCIAAAGFLNAPPMEEELEALRAALFDPGHAPEFAVAPFSGTASAGQAVESRVVGGSLALLVTTLGTPWEISTKDTILFLEDTSEPPYRIDRMVTHLRTAGKLEGLRGLVLGHFQDCDGEQPGLLAEVLADLFADAAFPVAQGLPAGHGAPNLAMPLGQAARLSLPAATNEPGRLAFI